MGLRGRIEASPLGRMIWPGGRPRTAPRSPRHAALGWVARTVRSMRGKERRDTPPRSLHAPQANALGEKLWRGFSQDAARELETICRSDAGSLTERCAAAWYLAEWAYFKQDFPASVSWLERMSGLDAHWRLAKPNLILQVENQLALGRFADAERLLADATERYSDDADLWLLASNLLGARRAADAVGPEADEQRLALINRMLTAANLTPIRRIDAARPLRMDNIAGDTTSKRAAGGPKISVLMPAYNAEDTIGFALRGLLEQTWRDLEVIVADDGSTDGTREIVERHAAQDPRIRLVRSEQNAGPYVARNLALSRAGGEFVTVHDADDWSHPQKLEIQISSLLESGKVANMSAWIRMTAELQARHLWRARSRFAHANHSSLMLRKDAFAELGGWDPVKYHADAELVQRIVQKYGVRRVQWMSRTPLSFGLVRAASLTGSGASHINSLLFGARHEYHRAFSRWHEKARESGGFYLDAGLNARRPFPAPMPMLLQAPAGGHYDAILAGDLALAGKALGTLHREVEQALGAGLRVGLFHWPRYELDVERKIDERLAALIDAFRIDMIVANQRATATNLVFFDPPGLRHAIDRVPGVSFEHLSIVDWTSGDEALDREEANRTLERLFGTAGRWLAALSLVAQGSAAEAAANGKRAGGAAR